MRTLVWFRRDLRVRDQAALSEASRASSEGVVGIFVICPEEWRNHDDAPVKIDFWLRNLQELSEGLKKLNIPLLIVEAPKTTGIASVLLAAAKKAKCGAIYFNEEYEVNERRRDEAVARHFEKAGLAAKTFHDHVVFDPSSIRTGEGRYYTVYTPFKKSFIKRAMEDGITLWPAPKKQAAMEIESDDVPRSVKGFESKVDAAHWPAGEAAAMKRLETFCAKRIGAYKLERDLPAIDATSRLSPYLNSGVVSPRQCLVMAQEANRGMLDDRKPAPADGGAAHWISEVIWREFYQHVMTGFPRVCMHRAFKPATEKIRWMEDEAGFAAWCAGRTGVPIVDAAMRQLAALGWMHNRLRMVVAMYLTKDLFLDWRLGEKFFMQHLVDGDLGSNNGGWQWSASTGTDAAPYFRIFNPVSQSERCDPQGEFIRRWVPELAGVEGDAIHDPSRLPALLRLKLDYPVAKVDRTEVRERVMAAFKAVAGA